MSKPIEELNKNENSNKLRPLSFDDYIGQEKVKKQLNIFIEAAKIKGSALPHSLFFGPPGLGKTTLAEIISNTLGKNIIFTSAPSIEKGGDIASLVMDLKKGDILFIDEIHALKKSFEELLYPAMEDFVLDIKLDNYKENQGPIRIPIEEFCLIGATTRPGLLSNPFRDRFTITQQLEYYTVEELNRIIQRSAKILGLKITSSAACNEIAIRSRGTARIANNLLKLVGDYAIVKNNGNINLEITKEALDDLNIDSIGLDNVDRKILHAMAYIYKEKAVGIKNLATYAGEDKDTIESMVEPYLLQQGLILRTEKGRKLTDKGLNYVTKNIKSIDF